MRAIISVFVPPLATGIGDTGLLVLSEVLKVNTSIQSLDLHHNGISDIGCICLAEALSQNSTVTYLDLSLNKIGAFHHPPPMFVLLHIMNTGDAGAQELADCLKVNKTLRDIRLRHNEITVKGSNAIAAALPSCSLRRLDLGFNQIHRRELQPFADYLVCFDDHRSSPIQFFQIHFPFNAGRSSVSSRAH